MKLKLFKKFVVVFSILLSLSLVPGCKKDDGGGKKNQLLLFLIDPLLKYQWHLFNSGQNAFSSSSGTAGEDINLQYTWILYNGTGVIVAVVDSGLEIAHEDLAGNVSPGNSWDFVESDTDPTNTLETKGDHGTSVAGLIAAQGENGLGGKGVAPKATLVGYNFLESSQTNAEYIAALGGSSSNPASNTVYIFNQSFGLSNSDDYTADSTRVSQLIDGVTNLRDGKGAIYVKSAGNGFQNFGSAGCTSANNANLSCQNTNMDPYNALPYNILVGALNADGVKSTYSTAGSGIWISAPGGEYGTNSTYVSGGDPEMYAPAMITTDQSGCSQGYSRSFESPDFAYNAFEENYIENLNCNYTSIFNGTSSAAPVTSGVVALLLDKSPNLTWRDVKHVLAETAEQVDASDSGTTIQINSVDYLAEQGWVTNSAGYAYHNFYGFGRVDVAAAINYLDSYTPNSLGTFTDTTATGDTTNSAIPDNNASGASNTASVATSLIIEAVQLTVNITHTYTGDLGVELTSPAGTRSVLLNVRNGFSSSDNLTDMVLLSAAFYGEASNGTWTMKIVDSYSGDTGALNSWSIKIFGHTP